LHFIIKDHAIRRYKRRIGYKTSSKKKVVKSINNALNKDLLERRPSYIEGYHILVTSKFQAVVYRNKVVTVTELDQPITQETISETDVSEDAQLQC